MTITPVRAQCPEPVLAGREGHLSEEGTDPVGQFGFAAGRDRDVPHCLSSRPLAVWLRFFEHAPISGDVFDRIDGDRLVLGIAQGDSTRGFYHILRYAVAAEVGLPLFAGDIGCRTDRQRRFLADRRIADVAFAAQQIAAR